MPNPTTGLLTAELEGNIGEISRILVIDSRGVTSRVTFNQNGNNTVDIDLQHYPQGMYFIRLLDDLGKEYADKVILMK